VQDVDVILPVLNEAEAIPWVLERMPTRYRPIVVDNGSSDESADLARAHGATVVDEPHRGFGAACAAGLAAANAPLVCFMDCDHSLDPQELPRVIDPVEAGDVDLALGARQPERGAWPPHARLANRLLAAVVRHRTGLGIRDIGPMRAARRTELLGLAVRDRRFGWPLEMVLLAREAGMRIEEFDVSYRPRAGRSKVTGSVLGTARAVSDMAKAMR
jgi:glycosyltransferase involved in cell wall biosynthesis